MQHVIFRDREGRRCWLVNASSPASATQNLGELVPAATASLLLTHADLQHSPELRRFVATQMGLPAVFVQMPTRPSLIERLRGMIERRQLLLYRLPLPRLGGPAGEEPQEEITEAAPPRELDWIEIYLVDEEDQPVPRAEYEITLPDQSVQRGTLDAHGFARIENIPAGQCKVTFPRMDRDAWEKI